MMTLRKLIVRLEVSEEDLARRAEQLGREADLARALRIRRRTSPGRRRSCAPTTPGSLDKRNRGSVLEELAARRG
jgi:hypothetical protein